MAMNSLKKKIATIALGICLIAIALPFSMDATDQFDSGTHLISADAMNTNTSYDVCNIPNTSFQAGEHLEYKVYYNWTAVWMSAGRATFDITSETVRDRAVHHVVSIGKTAPGFNWFFKVYDRYETYLDQETMLPLKYVRSVKEGKYTKENRFEFFPNENRVHVDYRKRMKKLQQENEDVYIPNCTQDLLSSIYYTRSANYENMEVGDVIPVNLFLDGELEEVYLRYLGKDVLKHKFGKFNCVKFAPSLLESDVFEGGEDLILWATDDDNRLPLMIESPLRVGSVKAYLVDYSGLRHPLTSRID